MLGEPETTAGGEGPPAAGAFYLRVFTPPDAPWRARITHAASGASALVTSGAQIVAFLEAQLGRSAAESAELAASGHDVDRDDEKQPIIKDFTKQPQQPDQTYDINELLKRGSGPGAGAL